MKKKRVVITVIILLLAVAGISYGIWYYFGNSAKDKNDKVYVEKVSVITGMSAGFSNRYSGVVEPQKTVNVNADAERTVNELQVEEGDIVEEGAVLFNYKTQDLEMDLEQAKLEMENIDNEIANYKTQITELTAERDAAAEADKFDYTTQIQTLQTNIKQSEYQKESKQLDIDKIEANISNSEVTAPISGVVKTINSTDGVTPSEDTSQPFISILATGGYRIRGEVNEQNVSMLSAGLPVIIRSRINEEQTWNGVVDTIDVESPESNSDNSEYGTTEESSLTSSSNYPFYISLDDIGDLMLGQHVYIELDMGQTEVKEGLWLYSGYMVTDETGSYVWADDGSNKLIRKKVTLGEYDESLDEYEITAGLTIDDYIAWPMEALYEGVTTVTTQEEVDYTSDLYNQESSTESLDTEFYDTEFYDEEMYDEEMYDEEMYGTEVIDPEMNATEFYDTQGQEEAVNEAGTEVAE
ncbi:MAG: efflux RND transporter periplasmic adaptor subunit [Lachnospiraceae bacterium]